MKFLLLFLSGFLSISAQTNATVSTVIVEATHPGARVASHIKYYDDHFLFLGTDYSDPGEPALYIHSRKHNKWRRISQISTKDAKFGSTQDRNSERLKMLPIAWDYRSYTNKAFVEVPLKTSASINHPDAVELEREKDRYKLSFNSRLQVESALTVLYIKRSDLERAFQEKAAFDP